MVGLRVGTLGSSPAASAAAHREPNERADVVHAVLNGSGKTSEVQASDSGNIGDEAVVGRDLLIWAADTAGQASKKQLL